MEKEERKVVKKKGDWSKKIARRFVDMSYRINLAWLGIILVIVSLEVLLVPYFVPTMTMMTPQEEKYLLPWKDTFNLSDFPISMDIEVHNLVFPDRATPLVNDVIVYSFNITNLTNRTLEINHTLCVVSPIFESFKNTSFTVNQSSTISLEREKVVFKNEGMNEVDILFNITDSDRIRIEHYLWAITQQTENSILFSKYGQILTMIVLIPSTIIALRHLKDLVIKKTQDRECSQN